MGKNIVVVKQEGQKVLVRRDKNVVDLTWKIVWVRIVLFVVVRPGNMFW